MVQAGQADVENIMDAPAWLIHFKGSPSFLMLEGDDTYVHAGYGFTFPPFQRHTPLAPKPKLGIYVTGGTIVPTILLVVGVAGSFYWEPLHSSNAGCQVGLGTPQANFGVDVVFPDPDPYFDRLSPGYTNGMGGRR